MSTCAGCETAHSTVRATSSASSRPSRRCSKNGVSTPPGSISVTRMAVFRGSRAALRAATGPSRDRELGRRVERPGNERRPAIELVMHEVTAAALEQVWQRRPDRQRNSRARWSAPLSASARPTPRGSLARRRTRRWRRRHRSAHRRPVRRRRAPARHPTRSHRNGGRRRARDRPSSAASRSSGSSRRAPRDDAIAGLDGLTGGRGADTRGSAGHQHHGMVVVHDRSLGR